VLLGTTPNIHGFFRELAKHFDAGQPAGPLTQEDMELLLTLSAEHNYWLASPQENAAVGIKDF
jgi:hypothetical protein